MQESVKHFLLQRDKQMAQLGGGEERSAAVFSSAADALVPGSLLAFAGLSGPVGAGSSASLSPDSLPLSVRSANFMAAAGRVWGPALDPSDPGSTITEAPTSSAPESGTSPALPPGFSSAIPANYIATI